MIAVDTSALLAIGLDEPEANRCIEALVAADQVLISARTLAEALIVAGQRNVASEVANLIDALDFTIISVTAAGARQAAQAYEQWGKGVHPARLNFGDCFAYVVAREHNCPLLFVGRDFAKTDVERVS